MNVSYYHLKAMIECICDAGGRPFIVVNPASLASGVPPTAIDKESDSVILNLAPEALTNFNLDPVDGLTFHCRFNQVSRKVHIPLLAVASIFNRDEDGIMGSVGYPIMRSPQEQAERMHLFHVTAAVELDPPPAGSDASTPIGQLTRDPIDVPGTAAEPAVEVVDTPAASNVVQGHFGQRKKT